MKRLSIGFLLMILAAAPGATRSVGVAVRVLGEASWKSLGEPWQPLPERSPVNLGWSLLTGRRSDLVVTFRGRGFFHLGEKTQVLIDRPSLARATNCDDPELYVVLGAFRVAHATPGASPNVEIGCGRVYFASPDLTGEALGTDIRLHVDPRLGTIVHVAQGQAVVEPRARGDGEEVRVEAGQAILVAPDGSVSPLPVPWDPGLAFPGFLDDPPLLERLDPRTEPPK